MKVTGLRTIKFNPAEKLTLIYMLITGVAACYLWITTGKGLGLIGVRLAIGAVIFVMAGFENITQKTSNPLLRYIFIGCLFVYWYPETFYINRFFGNYDHLLAAADQALFGYQPSLVLAHALPQHWVSELMNMGYISYFPILIITWLYFYYTDRHMAEFYFFTTTFAFFLFYILFLLFPATGPQYYFQLIDSRNISQGVFTPIGNYFSQHYIHLKETPPTGIFKLSLDFIKHIAERPTGAFPSSHIGNTTLVMIMLATARKYKLTIVLLPLYCLLVLSTVYLQAHYMVDVFGGFAAAFVLYPLSRYLYPLFARKNELMTNRQKI